MSIRTITLTNIALLSSSFLLLSFYRHDTGFFFDFLIYLALFFTVFTFNFFKKQAMQPILFNISIFLVLHFLGHLIILDGTRLYDTLIIDRSGFWFRWDNLMHLYSGVILFSIITLLTGHKKGWRHNLLILTLLLGVSAFHEILEFVAILIFDIANEIGDYVNNALDLIYSLAGGITALLLTKFKKK